MKTVFLKIKGIHCKSCKMVIEGNLEDIGIRDIAFNNNELKLSFDENKLTLNQIKQAIKKDGYGVD